MKLYISFFINYFLELDVIIFSGVELIGGILNHSDSNLSTFSREMIIIVYILIQGWIYMYGDIGLDACAVIKIRKQQPLNLVGNDAYSYALVKAKDVQVVPKLFEVGM